MKYLFMYDISDNKRLSKVATILRKSGVRTQYSFFEIEATSPEIKALYEKIIKILNPEEDKLFVIPINKQDREKILRIGKIPFAANGVL